MAKYNVKFIYKKIKNGALFSGVIILPLLLSSCTTINPATGRSDFTPFMSPAREVSIGKEQHPLVMAQHGGVLDAPDLAGYVAVVGGRLAAASEMPRTPFTFTVLNSPIVNAFALPGGYIYVTRGILALFNSEAEMASVLGHEIGHVTARHSAKRYNQQLFTGLGVTLLGAALKDKGLSDALGYGSQIYLKSYSRSNEYESDQLGVRYSTRAGFDPYAAADMLKSLDAASRLQDKIANRTGQQRPPEFFSTHPNTKDRVSRAFAAAQKTGLAQNSRSRGQGRYLNAIDGMIYGDDPAQGLIKKSEFRHGPLRLTFRAPGHYRLINSPEAVYGRGTGPSEGGIFVFAGGALKGRNIIEYTYQTWKRFMEKEALQGLEELTINGMAAVTGWNNMAVNKIQSQVRVVAIKHSRDKAYFFLIVTPLNKLYGIKNDLERMIYSFKKLTTGQAKRIKGKIIRVITVQKGDTIKSLAHHMAFNTYKLDRFLLLNGLSADEKLAPGRRLKIVIHDK